MRADANQLYQVLVNLAINARDAMPDGGRVELGTGELELTRATCPERVRLADGAYAVLSVRDSGEGMSQEVIERAFEPFFTTKQPGSHTGLGLASVQEIVKQARGAIEVKSELGKGTQLRIFCRAPPRPRARTCSKEPRRRGRQRASWWWRTRRCYAAWCCARSEARGHRVVSARNGKEALELGLAEPPDLLVTDVILPGLDGNRLTAQLRERHPGLRVLFMSGYEPDVVGAAAADGRTRFLAKPFAISKLVESVDELLAQRQQASQGP